MDKSNLVQLTNYLYRLTILFPKKEPLRYKSREIASEILVGLFRLENSPENLSEKEKEEIQEKKQTVRNNLSILKGFFDIAKEQKWASLAAIEEIERQYDKIESDLRENKETEERELEKLDFSLKSQNLTPVSESEEPQEQIDLPKLEKEVKLGPRKNKILELMKRREKVQVGELCQIFPQTSKRTLRRDFRSLLEQGLIERTGESSETFYRLKSHQV
mgnify:CR=1 FL=1